MPSDIYTTGSAKVNDAANAGAGAIGNFNPADWANATNSGLTTLQSGQNKTQQDYQTAYKNQILANPSATDLYNTAYDKFNVGGLQNTSNQLNNAVLQAPISNLNTAKGFNYDNNQVQQKTAQDLMYLAPQANAAQNNVNTAQTNAAGYVTQGMAQNNMNLLPIQEQGQYLQDAFARQQSGYTTTQQAHLTALTDKMKQGVALSAAEMQAYSALSTAEASYQAAKVTADAAIKKAQLDNNYKILNPSQGLYSANTGQVTPYATNTTVPKNGLTY